MPSTSMPALAYWRTRRLLPQRELAARAGVRLHTIQLLEYGTGTSLETVRRLAAALNVIPSDLIHQPPGFDDSIVTPPAS